MSLIDDRGRLFGRVNLIDAIGVIVVLGLIPLAYGAFLMFRVPPPAITSITPDRVPEHTPTPIQIGGDHLRQFLDVRFGTVPSGGLFLKGPTLAEVIVPDLPAGTYDVVLVDAGHVVLRKPGALTVVAPTTVAGTVAELQAVGTFHGLSEAAARSIVAGAKFATAPGAPPVAEVLSARPAEAAIGRVKVGENAYLDVPVPGQVRVRAIVRVRCVLTGGHCTLGDVIVSQSAPLVLPSADGTRVRFLVDDVRPADARVTVPPARSAVATLRVRFSAPPNVLDLMKPGDVDVPGFGVVAEGDRAVLTQLAGDRQPANVQVTPEGLMRRAVQMPQTFLSVTGTIRVPVLYSPTGWIYKDRPVKSGASFNFETVAGGMTGLILDMTIGSER